MLCGISIYEVPTKEQSLIHFIEIISDTFLTSASCWLSRQLWVRAQSAFGKLERFCELISGCSCSDKFKSHWSTILCYMYKYFERNITWYWNSEYISRLEIGRREIAHPPYSNSYISFWVTTHKWSVKRISTLNNKRKNCHIHM